MSVKKNIVIKIFYLKNSNTKRLFTTKSNFILYVWEFLSIIQVSVYDNQKFKSKNSNVHRYVLLFEIFMISLFFTLLYLY